MQTYLDIDKNSEFSMYNFPFGIFKLQDEPDKSARCCSRLGNFVIDLSVLVSLGLLNLNSETNVFQNDTLNEFIGLGQDTWSSVRKQLQDIFSDKSDKRKQMEENNKKYLYEIEKVVMMLPCQVGDYTDFYSSKNHAENVGTMFRGKDNALQPNWLWLPVGYHGRSSSIRVSPFSFKRPSGQKKPANPGDRPKFEQSKRMDFELEMVTVVGKSNKLGEPVDIKNAWNHIFGYLIMNDVSARDLQAWEYVPLGPFTAKNLVTVVSPWIVTAEALQPFKISLPQQDPEPLPYLKDSQHGSYDLPLQVLIQSEKQSEPQQIAESNFKYLYWNPAQQLVHHTVTGCNLQVGDFLGSGTISGPTKEEYGSFLELSWMGKNKIKLNSNEERTFWENNDKIILRAKAQKDNIIIGFGECESKLLP